MGQHYRTPPDYLTPPQRVPPLPAPENSRTIALLEQWAREDASDDPANIAEVPQALTFGGGAEIVVVTTNPRHLGRFVKARLWNDVEA